MRVAAMFLVALLFAGRVAGATDPLAFAQRLTNELYLRPLDIRTASLRIEADRFDLGSEPHAFIVHVHETDAPAAREILTVNIVRVRGHLQYVSASGPAVERAGTSVEARRGRREAAVKVLRELGEYRTDGKERLARREGYVEVRFTHPDPPAWLFDTTTAVFHEKTGVLTMFGTPAVPAGE